MFMCDSLPNTLFMNTVSDNIVPILDILKGMKPAVCIKVVIIYLIILTNTYHN